MADNINGATSKTMNNAVEKPCCIALNPISLSKGSSL